MYQPERNLKKKLFREMFDMTITFELKKRLRSNLLQPAGTKHFKL